MTKCALCGGGVKDGTTTFAADFGDGVVVLRHVPAAICDQCGEAWVADSAASELEALVQEARGRGELVQVIDLAA